MDRLLKLLFIACLLVSGAVKTNAADGDKLSKGSQKECKKAVKRLKSENWTVSGGTKSIDQVMTEHFLALEQAGAGAFVIEGNGKARSANRAMNKAMTNAKSQYATMKESTVEGRTEVKVSNENSEEAATHATLDASYVSSTKQKVKEFTPTVMLYRQLSDDLFEARALYIVGSSNNHEE